MVYTNVKGRNEEEEQVKKAMGFQLELAQYPPLLANIGNDFTCYTERRKSELIKNCRLRERGGRAKSNNYKKCRLICILIQ